MTASPERFMNVCGSISAIFSPSMRPSAISASNFPFHPSNASMWSVWNARTARNPALCRVRSYFAPGFPSPTTSFIADASIDLACQHAQRRAAEPEVLAHAVLDEPQEARVERFLVVHHHHERRRLGADLRDAVHLRAVALLAEAVAALGEERVMLLLELLGEGVEFVLRERAVALRGDFHRVAHEPADLRAGLGGDERHGRP